MNSSLKRKIAAMLAAGTFISFAGCSIAQGNIEEKNSSSSYTDSEEAEYKEYLRKCEAFRKKYLIDNCTENSFGPFNYFGLTTGVSVKGHDLFDKSEIYIGNDVLDFAQLNNIYQSGKTKELGEYYTTKWLDIAETEQEPDIGHTMKIDKGLIFPIRDGLDFVMYSRCYDKAYSLAFERRINGKSDYIRYLTFEPN